MALARAIGQAIFKSLAPEGLPAGAMIKMAQKMGGGYRRTDMLADIRKYTGRIKYEAPIRAMGGNNAVPRGWMVETDLNEPGANYRVFGKAQFYDWNTGTEFEQTVSFYHTDLMKKDDYARDFNDYFRGGYQEENLELLSFDQTALEHNLGKPY